MNSVRLLKSFNRARVIPALLFLCVFLFSIPIFPQGQITSKLQFTETVPTDLLASRSVVLHDHTFKQNELGEIQKAFQKIGIDVVAYFETDVVLAGKDVTKSFSEYFTAREIKYLIFFEKSNNGFHLIVPTFNQMQSLFDGSLPAWSLQKEKLNELLLTVFQDSWRSQKKQNFLINESPETDITVNPFKGNRHEFYAIDLKVDNLAVPKFGIEGMDKELEDFFKSNYPLRYKITDAGADEETLRRQGLSYVLCFVHTRGMAAREILGYDMTKAESAYASVTFPSGQLQLKTIPAETTVYKFYFRHIGNGNVFFGTKWDADITWQDALRNHVLGFKSEIKIN